MEPGESPNGPGIQDSFHGLHEDDARDFLGIVPIIHQTATGEIQQRSAHGFETVYAFPSPVDHQIDEAGVIESAARFHGSLVVLFGGERTGGNAENSAGQRGAGPLPHGSLAHRENLRPLLVGLQSGHHPRCTRAQNGDIRAEPFHSPIWLLSIRWSLERSKLRTPHYKAIKH